MTEYTFQLSDAELAATGRWPRTLLARYRAMAPHALAHEEALWTAAGIVRGSWVVDLGCGLGTFLADLAERAGPAGRVAGVDDAEEAAATHNRGISTIAESWNGAGWQLHLMPSPPQPEPYVHPAGLSCTGPDACVAVGTDGRTLAETGADAHWQITPTPSP
jgi:hypothetical protein